MKSNIYEAIASKSIVTLQSADMLSEDYAQATFRVESRKDKDSIAAAVATHFKGNARVIPDTLVVGSLRGVTLARCTITPNNTRMPLRDADNLGLKVVSANVMKDTQNNIWSVRGKGDTAIISKQGQENLVDMLQSRISNKTVASVEPDARVGDFAKFFDAASETVDFGYVLDNGILSISSNKVVECTASAVIASILPEGADKVPQGSKEFLIDYYRRLYGKHPEFFVKLEEDINSL